MVKNFFHGINEKFKFVQVDHCPVLWFEHYSKRRFHIHNWWRRQVYSSRTVPDHLSQNTWSLFLTNCCGKIGHFFSQLFDRLIKNCNFAFLSIPQLVPSKNISFSKSSRSGSTRKFIPQIKNFLVLISSFWNSRKEHVRFRLQFRWCWSFIQPCSAFE